MFAARQSRRARPAEVVGRVGMRSGRINGILTPKRRAARLGAVHRRARLSLRGPRGPRRPGPRHRHDLPAEQFVLPSRTMTRVGEPCKGACGAMGWPSRPTKRQRR